MTNITDATDLAATNAHADAADDNNTGSTNIPVQPAADMAAFVVVSGTAKQVSTSRNAFLLVNITTAASFKLEIGPTSAVANTVNVAQTNALSFFSVFVPRGWYVKFTGTVTNYSIFSNLL